MLGNSTLRWLTTSISCVVGACAVTPRPVTPRAIAVATVPPAPEDDDVEPSVPDLPLVNLQATPARIWYESLPDGTVGVIRITGHAPTDAGERLYALVEDSLKDRAHVEGFVSYGVGMLAPAHHAPEYQPIASQLIKALTDLAEESPHFIEMRPIPKIEDDPALGTGDAAVRFRAPDDGPAFIPACAPTSVTLSKAARAGVQPVVSDAGTPVWKELTRRLLPPVTADLGGDLMGWRNVFFRVQPSPKGYDVSCSFVAVGPYVEMHDPTTGRAVIIIPQSPAPASPEAAK